MKPTDPQATIQLDHTHGTNPAQTQTQIQHTYTNLAQTQRQWGSDNRSVIGLGEMGSRSAKTAQLVPAKTARPAATRTKGRLTQTTAVDELAGEAERR